MAPALKLNHFCMMLRGRKNLLIVFIENKTECAIVYLLGSQVIPKLPLSEE